MKYEEFAIYDMKAGKVTAKEPWLLPGDAFETLKDCHIKYGVLEKRNGISEFGQLVHTNTATEADTLQTQPVNGIFAHRVVGSVSCLACDKERVNIYDTTSAAYIDLTRNKIRFKHNSIQNWTPSASAVVKGGTSGATATVEAVVVDTGTFAGNDANGTIIFVNGTLSGTFQDGEEIQQNGTPTNKAGSANGANTDDEFTGDNTDFFRAISWQSKTYITNNNDIIQKYDGTALTRFHIDLDVEGGPDNDVNSAKFLMVKKSRMILFNVTERGTNYPQRARWCDPDNPTIWPDDSYIDCPTDDKITGVGLLNDDIYVYFRNSKYRFAYTGDVDLPFVFQRVPSDDGNWSPNSIVSTAREILNISKYNILGMNGESSYIVDLVNPEFISDWVGGSIEYYYGKLWRSLKQIWFSYTSSDAEANTDGNYYPDNMLVLNTLEKNWATYSIPSHCMGITDIELAITWDSDIAWENIDFSWDEMTQSVFKDLSLIGGNDGKIYRMSANRDDDGTAISMEAQGGQWNPYWKEGKNVRFGYLRLLVDVDDNSSATIYFYKNHSSTEWKTASVDCSGSGDKKWITIPLNGEYGEFHNIKIVDNGEASRIRIHAIIPAFARGGLM